MRAGSAGLCVAALAVSGLAGLAAPAYADTTVTVQGTAFPDPARAAISLVGCADLFQRSDEELVPTIGPGPGAAPSGTRSLGWDLSGGNAIGAQFPVESMLRTTTASISVNAVGRATGVAYAGYQEPADAGTSLIWLGRSDLVTPGGAWQTIDAASRVYLWAKYDMATGHEVAPGPGVLTTVPGFATSHGGDGPGLYTIGFGCDGTAFSMDQLQVGAPGDVTTYDVEGLQTSVTIDEAPGGPGDDKVTITGHLHTGTGDPIPDATMILERRLPGSSDWKQVLVADVDHGAVKVSVDRDQRAFYRWRFVERPLAEGSTSAALPVDGLPTLPTDTATPTTAPTPTDSPSTAPTAPPTEPSSPPASPSSEPASPSDDPSPTASEPSSEPTTEPTTEPTSGPASEPASDTASPSAPESPRASDSSAAGNGGGTSATASASASDAPAGP